MESGNFNRRITIQKLKDNPVRDVNGEVDQTDAGSWETHAVRWAEMQTKGGREFWKVDKIEAEVTHLIRIPYDKFTLQITSEMRIIFETRTINIVAVYDPDEMHEVIEMQCKESK